MSILKSNRSTVNSARPMLISARCGKDTGSTRVAPALPIAVTAESKIASAWVLNPSKSRTTPILAPWRPLGAQHAERASAGSRVARVRGPLDDSCQYGCCVCDCSSVGANGVLCVRDGDDASSANQANSRFDTYESVGVRWADDAAVSLSADGNSGQ